MGINLKNNVVIIDEAHNIEATSRDAATFETNTSVIELVRVELLEVIKYRQLVGSNSSLLKVRHKRGKIHAAAETNYLFLEYSLWSSLKIGSRPQTLYLWMEKKTTN